MLQEYLKIMDVVKEYDSQLLTIKNWGVTLSLVAIGLGFKEKTWGYFLLAALSGVSFWVVEVAVKGYEMRYYPRMREIEYVLSEKKASDAPRVDWSWSFADEILSGKQPASYSLDKKLELMGYQKNYIWYQRIFLPQIMFPHVISVVLGMLLFGLAYTKTGRFKHYGP